MKTSKKGGKIMLTKKEINAALPRMTELYKYAVPAYAVGEARPKGTLKKAVIDDGYLHLYTVGAAQERRHFNGESGLDVTECIYTLLKNMEVYGNPREWLVNQIYQSQQSGEAT